MFLQFLRPQSYFNFYTRPTLDLSGQAALSLVRDVQGDSRYYVVREKTEMAMIKDSIHLEDGNTQLNGPVSQFGANASRFTSN